MIANTRALVVNCRLLTLCCLFLTAALLGPTKAAADIGAASRSVPAAELVGKGRMTYLGFKVFDAELFAPNGVYSSSSPFALKLTYLRNVKGKAIAESSVKEMKRQGGVPAARLASWEKQMSAIFPNVSRGQSITGVKTAGGSTVFYLGGSKIGTINDPEFSNRFFAIWLGNNTRNPGLRARLVGAGS